MTTFDYSESKELIPTDYRVNRRHDLKDAKLLDKHDHAIQNPESPLEELHFAKYPNATIPYDP